MSAIGDYIHLRYSNYKTYGTNKKGTGNKNSYTQYNLSEYKKNNVRSTAAIKNPFTPEELEALSGVLKDIKVNNSDNAKVKEAQQYIIKRLNEKFNESCEEIRFDNVTLTEDLDSAFAQTVGKLSAHRAYGNKNYYLGFNIKEVTDKIIALENILQQKTNSGEIKKEDFSLYKQTIKEIKEAYKNIYKDIPEAIMKAGYQVPKIPNLNANDVFFIRTHINELISAYAQYPAVLAHEGELFEDMLAATPYVAGQEASLAIDEHLFGGDIKANVKQYNEKKFSKNNILRKDYEDLKVQTYTQRAKVDVRINWYGKEAKIYAKNVRVYNDKRKWITVVEDTPLLYLLQSLDGDFVNHYLNIFTTHPGRGSEGLQSDRQAISPILKEILFYQGVTGNTFNRKTSDMANLMIINDKISGDLRIISMDDLINAVAGKTNLISVKIGSKSISSYLFNNKKVDNLDGNKNANNYIAAMVRVTNVLHQVHAAKVRIGFNYTDAIANLK